MGVIPPLSYPSLSKPLIDKNRKGVCRTLDCARPTRAFGDRALRELTSLLFSLPTAAETTIVGWRAETDVALTGEGGTQLAATCDRCSS